MPEILQRKLKKLHLEIQNINDLRDFRDNCYDSWDTCRRIQCVKEGANVTKTGEWTKHVHPYGFLFSYPSGWTINDDMKNKSTLLLPPGIALDSPGPKPIFLITAIPGINDISSLRSWGERQISEAKITSFIQEPFMDDNNKGSILNWSVYIPQSNTRSGFRVYVVFINNMAVCVEAFGPSAQTNIYDPVVRKVTASFIW